MLQFEQYAAISSTTLASVVSCSIKYQLELQGSLISTKLTTVASSDFLDAPSTFQLPSVSSSPTINDVITSLLDFSASQLESQYALLEQQIQLCEQFHSIKSNFPFVRPTIFILMPSSPVLLRSIPLLCLIFLDFKQRTIISIPSATVLLRPIQLLCLTFLVFKKRTLEPLPRVPAFRSIMLILIATCHNLSILHILFKILGRIRTRFVLLAWVTSTLPKTMANFFATPSTFKGWAVGSYLRQRSKLLFGLRWGV